MMLDEKAVRPPSHPAPPHFNYRGMSLEDGSGGKECDEIEQKSLPLQKLPALFGHIEPRRKLWSGKRLCVAFGGIVLIILVLSNFHSAFIPRVRQFGISRKADVPSLFGIGFHLTPSYGVSAIRYANGTFSNLARVDFRTETIDRSPECFYHMIQRLAESKSHRDPFASYCHDDLIGVGPPLNRRYLQKVARRAVGLPSTEDVGRLADAIRTLKEKTEDALGHSIDQVMITAPMLKQLCLADLREAAEYVGLTPQMDTYPGLHAHDVAAAYAGYGLGLCKDYQNRGACLGERWALPTKNTLTVLYTRDMLMTSLYRMQTTEINELPYPIHKVDWQGFMTQVSQRNSDAYKVQWQSIALRLVQLPIDAYKPIPKVDRVVVMGESGESDIMVRAVRMAMETLHQGESEYEVYANGTEFVAARGAAELGWRRHFGW